LPTAEDSPKLTWPPTKEDLQRLYVEQRLSAAKIAKIYGRNTKNPKSGAFLILHYLKKYGIERRDRIEDLRKRTESIVNDWKQRHPRDALADRTIFRWNDPESVGSESTLPAEEGAVFELLRNEGLSIEYLDPGAKARLDAVVRNFHWDREISLTDIAKVIGNKTSGYVSWLFRQLGIKARPFEEARLKGIIKKRKHKRESFDGTDEDKAYMLGLKHGDLYAYSPFGDAVRVSTSSTHPALAELFAELFSPYGHVYQHPRYKKDTGTYEWNFQVILDKSFGFLLEPRDKCREWVLNKESTMLAYLAGLIDAEGYIRPYANPRTVAIEVSIWNTDTDLLEFVYKCLKRLGYRPVEPYLSKPPGEASSGFHIARKKAEWRLLLARFEEAQSLLRRLPLRHREKVALKETALSVAKGDLFEKIADKVSSFRKSFKEESLQSTIEAEYEFLKRHPFFGLPPLSPEVLCTLQNEAWKNGDAETRQERLRWVSNAYAAHDGDLCWSDEPCVVICGGCDEENIVRFLVHESVHHALLWINGEGSGVEEGPQDIVRFMADSAIFLDDPDWD